MPRRISTDESAPARPIGRVKRRNIAAQTLSEVVAIEQLPEHERKRKLRALNRKLRQRSRKENPEVRWKKRLEAVRGNQTLDVIDSLAIARPKASAMSVRQALHACYYEIGGDRTFAKWAWSNRGDFYKLWARMLPIGVAGDPDKPIKIENTTDNEVARRIAFVLMQGLQKKLEPEGVTLEQTVENIDG